jgi:hypothetical protein
VTSSSLPWETRGARLHLPRDRDLAYVIGRMGITTSQDVSPLFFGSVHTARFAFLRLQKLRLLTSFARPSATDPAWFTLNRDAVSWVAAAMDCDESELRTVSGITRTNLAAVRARNRLWVSLVLACRRTPGAELVLFRPEWELRRARSREVLVPDAQVVLQVEDGAEPHEFVWFVELDAGTERLAVWSKKVEAYEEARRRGSLYGEPRWNVLVLVPTERRARSVARTCATSPVGTLVFLATQEAVEDGRALEPVLVRADHCGRDGAPLWTLAGECMPITEAAQRPRSTVERGTEGEVRGETP